MFTHRKIALCRKKYSFFCRKNVFFSTQSDFSMSVYLFIIKKSEIVEAEIDVHKVRQLVTPTFPHVCTDPLDNIKEMITIPVITHIVFRPKFKFRLKNG